MLIFRASAAAKAAARDLIRDLCGDVKNKLISMKTMQGLEKHLMCSPAACRDRSPIARDSDFHEFFSHLSLSWLAIIIKYRTGDAFTFK